MKLFEITKIKLALISATILTLAPLQNAYAQEEKKTQVATKSSKIIKTAIPILLADGYQIKSMQYLEKSMIFVLQRGPIAFVCETDHNGISKICVQIQ